MKLFLLRHATTDWSKSGQHTGRTDVPLNKEGEEEAQRAAIWLRRYQFDRVLVSPLARAQRTAQLVGLGDRAEPAESLLEIDYGEYEGRTKAEIWRERPGWELLRDGPKGGESLAHASERAKQCLAMVAEEKGSVLLISHGHMLRILTATYCGQPPAWTIPLSLGTACLSLLQQEHGHPAVGFWNTNW